MKNLMITLSCLMYKYHLFIKNAFDLQIITPATVIEIRKESETVKSLMLQIHDKQFSFKPGQW